MNKLALLLSLVLGIAVAAPGRAAADDGLGLVCSALVLCDENGHWLPGVDPSSECAQHLHQFCTDRQKQAAATAARWKRVKHYTKALSTCERKHGRIAKRGGHICSKYRNKLTKILSK